MKTEELKNKFTEIVEKIAGVKVDICFCSDGEWILQWEGTDCKPFENLKNKGLNVYGFEIDTEDEFNFAGCLLKIA